MPGACDSQCFAVQATLLWVGVAQHPLRDHTRIFQILLERVHRHPQPFPRTTAPPAGLPLAPTSIDLSAIPSCIRFTSAGSYPFFRQIVRTRSNVEFCLIRGRTCCEWQHSQGIWYNNNTTLIRVQVPEYPFWSCTGLAGDVRGSVRPAWRRASSRNASNEAMWRWAACGSRVTYGR